MSTAAAPPAPTRVLLVRHGESNVTVRRVVGGPRTCDGLSELGRRQAEALRDRFAREGTPKVDRLVASAYPRAIQTAEVLDRVLGRTVEVVEGFGEHDPGPDCDGVSFDEFVRRYGTPDWESDPHAVTFPGGETIAEFQLRVGAALRQTVEASSGQTVLVVCHGGVIDTIVRLALRTAPTGLFELHTKNTSITELVRLSAGRWRLERYNDAAHLVGLPEATPRDDG
jgi:broad specificity phosphatase PhoE